MQAAQIFNLYPKKGVIAPGSDADIAILDPSLQHTIRAATRHSRVDVTPYEGRKVTGKVRRIDRGGGGGKRTLGPSKSQG